MHLKINHPLRPCMVATHRGGKEEKALFHCWGQWCDVRVVDGFRGHVSETYGIIEVEDGTVRSAHPGLIRFLDSPFDDYAWEKSDE